MKLSTRKLGIISASATAAMILLAAILVQAGVAFSQQPPSMEHGMPGTMPDMMQHHQEMMQYHQQMMQQMHGQGAGQMDMATPTMPGQDAFGAIQEIVHILEADPNTDWSKVNLEALRQHLIDMNEVTLKANTVAKPIDGGIQVTVTGTGRTVEAIQRMIPAHAHAIEQNHLNGWSAKTEPLADGVVLTVTSSDPQQVQHIRGLGFIGVMVSGSHHLPHHLAMAKGEFVHSQ
jgi:hypothetical protein